MVPSRDEISAAVKLNVVLYVHSCLAHIGPYVIKLMSVMGSGIIPASYKSDAMSPLFIIFN